MVSSTTSQSSLVSPAERPGVFLAWRHVRYVVHAGKKKESVVLDGVSGDIAPKQVLAIMGPSGSGKTSLLNVLAGRLPSAKHASLSGNVRINGHDLTAHAAQLSAYVEQQEALFALSTVRETLWFTAQLRLPSSASHAHREQRVEATIRELNLVKCADTLVGGVAGAGPQIRGLSGGERRRVTIGIELLNNPPVVFMDEPTSGLDGAATIELARCLGQLRLSGLTIICVIPQPRLAVYEEFTHLLLLGKGGRQVYCGRSDLIEEYFTSIGFRLPERENPADWLIDVVCGLAPRLLPNGTVDEAFRAPADLYALWEAEGSGAFAVVVPSAAPGHARSGRCESRPPSSRGA